MFRMQMFMLLLAWGFPLLGGYALHMFKGVFPSYSVLISEFNITLFILVAIFRPTREIAKLLNGEGHKRKREIDFPTEEVRRPSFF